MIDLAELVRTALASELNFLARQQVQNALLLPAFVGLEVYMLDAL